MRAEAAKLSQEGYHVPLAEPPTLSEMAAAQERVREVLAGDDKGVEEAPQYTREGTLPPESVLAEANRLVTKERSNTYGPPEQDFTRTAGMMNALFSDKLREGEAFDAKDVALAMMLVKVSRATWMAKRDNWADIAGYAACGHRCQFGEW